jgi:hypothetical protein
MLELIARVLGLCLALAGAEMLHGIARVRLLVPRIGMRKAQQVSIITGSMLAFAVCGLVVPTIGVAERGALLLVGLCASVFMASFDVLVARTLAKRSWAAIADDFNPRKGNYLLFGLVLLVLFPYIVMALTRRL